MLHRRLCAAALIATAAIHLAVVPEHLGEWPAAGVFFAGLAIAETVLAVLVLARTDRRLLLGGAVLSVASAALWAFSRSMGLPLGPEVFRPEAVALPDVTATVLEAATAVLLLRLAAQPTPTPTLAEVRDATPVH